MRHRLRFVQILPLFSDVLIAGLSAASAVVLRVGFNYPTDNPEFLGRMAAAFAGVAALVFFVTGSYRTSWRFVSLREAIALIRAAVLANLLFLPVMFLAVRLDAVPRSFLVINTLLLTALLLAPRLGYRLIREGRIGLERRSSDGAPVLLYGATTGADLFLRALEGRHGAEWRVIGIIDDAAERRGARLRGIPILGSTGDLPDLMDELEAADERPRRLVVTDETLTPADLRRLVELAKPSGLEVARVPRLTDLHSGSDAILALKPIAIEDLLGRPPANLDLAPVKDLIRGRRVMVTGAGGSIGSELVRQLIPLAPCAVTLVDCAEPALYEIDQTLREMAPHIPVTARLVDVRHAERIRDVVKNERPELIFHAAAFKHVPMVEANPIEGAWTNVIGTKNVADAALETGATAMVLISTDKAVNPSSVMGASKRLAEVYCQALDLASRAGGTRFVTVRFGNVLGSTGSVVPLFKRQLARGGPLTVTHPEMRRYFMTIAEAVSLVLQAVASALEGQAQAGCIRVLDMGEPVRIVDLAREMIRLAGLEPHSDIDIVFTGVRPGEKLEEELFHDKEPMAPTAVPGVLLASPRIVARDAVEASLRSLEAAIAANDAAACLAAIRSAVPELQTAVLHST